MKTSLIHPSDDKSYLGMHSVTDIGRRPNGKQVSKDHYLAYERSIVYKAVCFLGGGDKCIKVLGVERSRSTFSENRKLEKKYGLDRVLLKSVMVDGQEIDFLALQDIIRLCLRECLWCVIVSGGRGIYFGYDLNVYFCGGVIGQGFSKRIREFGMVVKYVNGYPSGFKELAFGGSSGS